MKLNTVITQNTTLSWGAKGLLCYLLSTADGLDVNQLVANFKEGRDATYRLINELKAAGYVEEYSIRDKGRIKERGYTIHSTPIQTQKNNKAVQILPDPEKPDQVKPDQEIQDQAKKLVPGKSDQAFPQPIKNNTFKKQNQKQNLKEKAAAKVFNTDLTNTTSVDKPVAAFLSSLPVLQTTDLMIANTLTLNQVVTVKARIKGLTISYYAPEKLIEEVIITLLQPKSFSQAGTDFLKKLNTIIKTINERRWTPPSVPKVSQAATGQQVSPDNTVQSLYVQRSCLISTVNAFAEQTNFHRTKNNLVMANQMQSQVDDVNAQLAIINAQLVKLESMPPIVAVN